jgi:hypothetical protein
VWTDTAFDAEQMRPLKVGFMSEDYFRLAAARPEWGAYLAVGERVLVVLPGADGPTAYLVVEPGDGEAIQLPATPTAQPTPAVAAAATPTPGASLTATPPPPARRSAGLCRGAAVAVMLSLVGMLPYAWRR